MASSNDTTARFATLEAEMRDVTSDVKEIKDDMRRHNEADAKVFKDLSDQIKDLGLKVMALATAGGILGPLVSHFLLGGH